VDAAVAVDRGAHIDVDRTPCTDVEFVARPHAVIGRDRRVADRGEGVGLAEEVGAKQRQRLPAGFEHEPLEIIGRQGRQLGRRPQLGRTRQRVGPQRRIDAPNRRAAKGRGERGVETAAWHHAIQATGQGRW